MICFNPACERNYTRDESTATDTRAFCSASCELTPEVLEAITDEDAKFYLLESAMELDFA